MNLKDKLIQEGKTRWLDVGCGDVFEEDFLYIDIYPEGIINPKYKDRYFRVDIINAPKEVPKKLGKFDFIRMQHVLEHFSYEEGQKALRNCAVLLKRNGIILITIPDLRIHIKDLNEFKWWANRRIPEDAPNSFYFSIFAHGIPYGGKHNWCYDFDGLKYQLQSIGGFKNISELKLKDRLANVPFTHNRPEEDLCLIATKSH